MIQTRINLIYHRFERFTIGGDKMEGGSKSQGSRLASFMQKRTTEAQTDSP